jgi:DNA-binding HxlR family transcriptional regulator
MLGRTYDREVCSAARALEIAGERWSLLILRNAAFAGMTRFGEFQESLGLAPNVLAARLDRFVEDGLMTALPGPAGHAEYRLTEKGLDFKPVIIALTQWGDRWAAPDGPPIVYQHDECGGQVRARLHCEKCGERVAPGEVSARKTAAMARARERRQARAAKGRRGR